MAIAVGLTAEVFGPSAAASISGATTAQTPAAIASVAGNSIVQICGHDNRFLQGQRFDDVMRALGGIAAANNDLIGEGQIKIHLAQGIAQKNIAAVQICVWGQIGFERCASARDAQTCRLQAVRDPIKAFRRARHVDKERGGQRLGGKVVAGCLNGLDIEIVLSLNRAGDGDDMALL